MMHWDRCRGPESVRKWLWESKQGARGWDVEMGAGGALCTVKGAPGLMLGEGLRLEREA